MGAATLALLLPVSIVYGEAIVTKILLVAANVACLGPSHQFSTFLHEKIGA